MCGSSKESRTKEGLMLERVKQQTHTQKDRQREREANRGRERLMHCHVLSDHPLVYTLLNSNRG